MQENVVQNNSQVKLKKKELEDHHRISSFSNNTKSITACNDSLKSRTSNAKVVCVTCGKCMFNSNHDACVSKYINDMNARTKKPKVVPISTRKPTKNVNQSVATPHKITVASETTIQKSSSYFRMLYEKTSKTWTLWIEKQCPSGYIWKPKGNDLLMGTRRSDLYIITLQETSSPTPICFMAKASPTQAWLWHRRLSHLNFDTINLLSKNDIVNGLPKLNYVKDQLCSSCKMGNAKTSNFKTKTVPSLEGRSHLLHMDLFGLMLVESINRRKIHSVRDGENLDKMKEKEDPCIFVRYYDPSCISTEDPYWIMTKREKDYREMITSQLQGKLWLYDEVRLDFAKVLDDETTLTFLLDLGYKGPLHKHPSMYVDHMHQPWRTLAAIINKCLSGKAASNDRLRESKIDIIWGMFYRENVDYLELIWEDFAFQIDYRQLKKGRSENMPYPSRGKGSQWKKTTDTSEADVEVSEESDSEPMRKQTSSRRVIKKKVIISTDDNIIPEPNIALEIMTKSVPEPARRRPSGIDFRDTSSVSKKKSHDLSQKLKGVQTLTPKEQLVADTMKALKESKKQQKTASERTGTKPGVLDEENVTSESPIINLEKIDDEETDDEFVHSEENVQDDDEDTDDEETDDELVHANEQVDVEKTKVVKDEIKKAKLPPKISSLFVSPGFDPLHVVIQRVYVLKKDVQELKEVDNTITLRTSLISEIPSAINAYLGSSLGDALQKEDPKKVLRKRDHDNEDPLTGPNQGKKTKKSRAKESESSKKSSTSKETSTGKTRGVLIVHNGEKFERMETVFRISNCIVENQIKFAPCTILGSSLTWWNSQVRTVGHDVAYAMTWTNLKKMMTDKYCPRGEELALMCARMFLEESDKIEKYVGGLPDMIHGSVLASKPKTMQDAIEFATELMDKKIRTFTERQAENKRKLDNNNQAQQQPPKKQGAAIAYTAGSSERKEYARTLPLCNKCKFHHNGQCTVKCTNYKRVGHFTRDCRSPAATNNQRNLTCYEYGNQGHYKSDCPELKNRNHENQAEGTEARGMVYFIGGGETDQDPNNMEDEIEA
ncbi:RNA-directed DNA polymerase, eukaryota [Tanacetum coccineum]|uniref:RNA-directed DNA polymerase, eukaryota n=1 Tax=Tanacetum coccineum TaxID=301880 RepID=A0ABQ5AK11_9ASTR